MYRTMLLAALVSLAFAPAPLSRRVPRSGDTAVSLALLQGPWKVIKFETSTTRGFWDRGAWPQEIQIEGDRWQYISRRPVPGEKPITYVLAVDGTREPATIDFTLLGRRVPCRLGLLVRKGNELKVLYSDDERPPKMDPRTEGYVLLTLRRGQ